MKIKDKIVKFKGKESSKILAEFPGVSKKTAEYLLEHHSLAEIIFTDPIYLEDFMKSPSRRLGPAVAKKINAISIFT